MVNRFVPKILEVKYNYFISINIVEKIVKGLIDRYHIVFINSSISASGPAENEN